MLQRMTKAWWCMLILFCVVFTVHQANAEVTWVKSGLGQPLPGGAILGGVEKGSYNNGMPMYVCRAEHAGSFHSGKLIAGKCNISYGGREIEKRVYQVAVGSGVWGRPNPRYTGALIGGQEPGRTLYVCRVNFVEAASGIRHGFHPGKVVDGKCNFGFGGLELSNPAFEVFYPNAAPTAPPISKTSKNETRSEILIKNDTNSQISFFITTQKFGRLNFTWKPGLNSHPSVNNIRLMASGRDMIEIADWGKARIDDVAIFNNGEWHIVLSHAYKIMH